MLGEPIESPPPSPPEMFVVITWASPEFESARDAKT
jgi:hypothetical protein